MFSKIVLLLSDYSKSLIFDFSQHNYYDSFAMSLTPRCTMKERICPSNLCLNSCYSMEQAMNNMERYVWDQARTYYLLEKTHRSHAKTEHFRNRSPKIEWLIQ